MLQPATLFILKLEDGYTFHLASPVDSPLSFAGGSQAPSGTLDATTLELQYRLELENAVEMVAKVVYQFAGGDGSQTRTTDPTQPDPLERLGRLMFSTLLPQPIQDALRTLSPDVPLVIATNDAQLPWELLHDDVQFLALKRPVSRRLLSNRPARHSAPRSSGRRAFLFIANPTGDLPQADAEAEQLVNLLDASTEGIFGEILCRGQATRVKVLQALTSSEYDLIHYSGHAEPGALLLADGKLSATEIQGALRGQPFVFLNACDSAREGAGQAEESPALPYAGLEAHNLASAFILGGALGFMGTLWPVYDDRSRQFAGHFYGAILRGEVVGEALRRMRQWMLNTHPTDLIWASFVLYGDPTLRIAGLERRETRLATVLVARLSGLLQLFDALDLETAAEIEDRIVDQLSRIARRYGGEPRGPLTDILGVRFGVPHAHEDDAERAIRTALDMIDVFQTFEQAPEQPGSPTPLPPGALALRLGISTGQVVGRQIQTPQGIEYQIAGDVVDRAARLAAQADAGQIWIDDNTHRLAQTAFTFEPLGALTIEEGVRPVTAHRVLGQREDLAPATALIGRESEIRQLCGWWHEAAAGRGRLVGLVGTAGVGKTRLVQAFREQLAGHGHRWVAATCQSYDQQQPYALLSQVIHGLAGIGPDDDAATRRTRLETLVRGVVRGEGSRAEEQFNEGLSLLGRVVGLRFPVPAVDTLEPELRQKKLAGIVQTVLAHQAARDPIILALEDLHWIDEASLTLLDQVVGGLEQVRVLALAVYRSGWSHGWAGLHHYRHLPVDELDENAQRDLLSHLLQVERPPAELTQALLSRTGGNPFFIEEVVQSLQEDDILTRSGEAWVLAADLTETPLPDRIENVILARLARLAPPSRETLQTASVIGPEFEYQVLEEVQDEAAREQLDRSLGDLTARNLILQLGGWWPDVNYAFSHGLIHQTAYAHLLERFRRTVHRLVAQVLRRLYDDADIVERLARHYYHSDDRVNAVRFCLSAGRRAADEWANRTALNWHARALEKIHSFDDEPPTETERARGATETQILQWHVEALESQAEVLSAIGQNDEAIAGYQQALALLADSDVFSVSRQAGLHRKMAIAHQNKGEFEAAQKALSQGLHVLEGEATLEAGRLHVWTGLLHYRQGRLSEGLDSCERGIVIIEQADSSQDPSTGSGQDLAQAHNLRGLILHELGRSEEAKTAHDRSIRLYEEAAYIPGKERACSLLGCVYQDLGQWDEALRYFQAADELSDRTGEEWRRAAAAINLGEIYRRRGELDQAIEAYGRARQIAQAFDFAELVGLALMNLGASYLKRGQIVEARGHLEESLDLFQRIGADRHLPEVLHYLAELQVMRGQPADALGPAQEALDRALELGHQLEVGHARRVLGQVYRALGQLEAADTQLTQSLGIFEEQNSPYEIGLTLLELVQLRKAQADTAENGEALREQTLAHCNRAIAIFEELGAMLDLKLVQEVRASL